MKRLLLSLLMMIGVTISVSAMSYEEARERAWFLTDKMAYELNLTNEQYDRAYEVNLEYLMSIRRASDCTGIYWTYRNTDFRYILFDWQYNLYTTLSYFYRPVYWVRSAWYYPVCDHYRYGHYYFHRPTVYVSYRGGRWLHRGRNDYSPYRGVTFTRGNGMRDRYHGNNGNHSVRPGRDNGKHNGFGGGTRPGADKDKNHGIRPGRDNNNHVGVGGGSRPGHGNNSGIGGGARPDNGKNNGVVGGTRPGGGNNSGIGGGTRPGRGNVGTGMPTKRINMIRPTTPSTSRPVTTPSTGTRPTIRSGKSTPNTSITSPSTRPASPRSGRATRSFQRGTRNL